MALYVVARGRRVGIDIEYICEDFAALEMADRFFSKDEVEALKALSSELRTRTFFNCWTGKESLYQSNRTASLPSSGEAQERPSGPTKRHE
jgi:4'-phosphopantetheinyl transferase